jgi:hypothetical protein
VKVRTNWNRIMEKVPEGHDHILHCPLCDEYVHSYSSDERMSTSQPVWPEMQAVRAESAAVSHFLDRHRLRYRLWEKTRWRWPIKGFFG